MTIDFRNKSVLVTGGTMGIGLATALAFGRHGASCILTHKWETADEESGSYSRIDRSPELIDAVPRLLGDTDVCVGDAKVKCKQRVRVSISKNKAPRGQCL